MITVKDDKGRVRQAKIGERVRFRNGSEYVIGKSHELRAIAASTKKLSPGKATRKARRAEELRRLQGAT